MSILKPGMRCVIIGEERGCEANIGALVTITRPAPCLPGEPARWLFKDASRPLVMVNLGNDRLAHPVTHSYDPANRLEAGEFYRILACYLMPIKGDGLDSEPPKAERDLPQDPATLAWARSVAEKTLSA